MKIAALCGQSAFIIPAAKALSKSRSAIVALLGCLIALGSAAPVHAGPGKVLPPSANPKGYSLQDMAAEIADFTINGNDLTLYPDTPFQVLYRSANNTFTVAPGTALYVKSFFVDDTEPVIGDFPENAEEAVEYIFGRSQLGAHDFEIEVDGKVTSLDRAGYIGGPVPAIVYTEDGEEEHNIIQIAAFVTPLKKGTHEIVIRGVLDGDVVLDLFGEAYSFSATYTVIVE